MKEEIDVLELIKTMRIANFIASVLVDQRQLNMVKFFDDYTPKKRDKIRENDDTVSE